MDKLHVPPHSKMTFVINKIHISLKEVKVHISSKNNTEGVGMSYGPNLKEEERTSLHTLMNCR